MTRGHLKKTLILLLKLGISFALLTWLFRQATADQSFRELSATPKHWPLLATAGLLCMLAVILTIVRWYILVRALALPFRPSDAFRLGFLGYLLNFFSLGSVGGDLFKAVFIAREQPARRAQAVATVFFDRLVGLYALFVVASGASLAAGLYAHPEAQVRVVATAALGATALGALFIGALLIPGVTGGTVSNLLTRIPAVGPTIGQLIQAVRLYRQKFSVIVWALVMSLAVHALFTLGFYSIAHGLLPVAPGLSENFLVVPISLLASALPLPFAGLGALEGALDYLYQHVSTSVAIGAGQGLVVALCYRIITMLIAAVGVVYWLSSRREVIETMHEIQAESEHEGPIGEPTR